MNRRQFVGRVLGTAVSACAARQVTTSEAAFPALAENAENAGAASDYGLVEYGYDYEVIAGEDGYVWLTPRR